jgi:hypothetical protein
MVRIIANYKDFRVNPPRGDIASLLVASMLATLVPIAVLFFVPDYVEMFSGFPELWPPQTRILFSYYYLALLFPVLVIGVWYSWPMPKGRRIATLGLSVFGIAALDPLFVWAVAPQELVLEVIRRSIR